MKYYRTYYYLIDRINLLVTLKRSYFQTSAFINLNCACKNILYLLITHCLKKIIEKIYLRSSDFQLKNKNLVNRCRSAVQ